MEQENTESLTVLCPSGLVEPDFFQAVGRIVSRYGLTTYLSTSQNLRLLEVRQEDREAIMEELAAVGARFKGHVKFPFPRVCVSRPHCRLGTFDTFGLSKKITQYFNGFEQIKPKLKIAISGCTVACSGPLTTDIGIVGTRKGLEVYVGGKLGAYPKVGRRIARGASEDQVLAIIEALVTYHYRKTKTKQRLAKYLDEPDFPYPDAV